MTRRATLEVHDTPDVLVRVLTTLRRRGCRLLAVEYRTADRHRRGRLAIDYVAPARCEQTVCAWLHNLVDVISVQEA